MTPNSPDASNANRAPHAARALLARALANEDLNFLLTNRIPRIAATRFMGWFSQLRQPLVSRPALWLWRHFADLNLEEAQKERFDSVHDCFVRALKPGMRPVDPDPSVLSSPCDAIVGETGIIEAGRAYQAKGFPYTLAELMMDDETARPWLRGTFVTLRITASMYHRFHAPADGRLMRVDSISGDTWNVNPIALKRVERLFCRNERALLQLSIGAAQWPVALVPVAAVLVASLRLHRPDLLLHGRYTGPRRIDCDVPFAKGDELGWFQHGSTILVFAPPGFTLAPGVCTGAPIRVGEALLRLPGEEAAAR